MRRTLLLTQRDIERLMTMKTALRVVEQAFKAQANGAVLMPPKIYLTLPDGVSDFRAMPAYLAHPAACGIKWVNVHPRNRTKGLPTVMAIIVINDPATGFPLAVLDGLSVTRMRTGAAAGVAAKTLARPRSKVVGLVGCGAQALSQLHALAERFALQEVRVWGYRSGESRRFCRQMRRRIPAALVPVATVASCVREADIVVTITPSRRPLVMRDWIRPGTHINAIGADAPGKQELDPRLLREAIVVVDDRAQAIHGGEINVPVAKGQFRPAAIRATLGEILLGRAAGRTSPQDITIFDSTGVAVHDVALGHAVVRQALRHRRGRSVQLFS